ncbi:hypothetical protein BCV72DRAFT_281822, partial [Rhizopus microsporus var. microsporus]
MNHYCNVCSLSFETDIKLANHKYDAHIDLVKASFGDETVLVSRVDGKFTCPKCSNRLISPTTLNRHLSKMHDGHCSTVSKRRKRPYSEEPIILTSVNGKSYHFLTSLENMQDILVDQPAGQWTLPIKTETATRECTNTNSNHLFQYFASTSPFCKHISSHKYIELSKSVTESVNKDWTLFPQFRYAVFQLFAGAILIEQSSAILINCVEPYGRLKSTDAHYERRLATTMNLSSYPKKECKYDWITVVQTQEDNAMKLKIGTTTCNLLVTSSLRLDKNSSISHIIEIGPNRSHFIPTDNTSIY